MAACRASREAEGEPSFGNRGWAAVITICKDKERLHQPLSRAAWPASAPESAWAACPPLGSDQSEHPIAAWTLRTRTCKRQHAHPRRVGSQRALEARGGSSGGQAAVAGADQPRWRRWACPTACRREPGWSSGGGKPFGSRGRSQVHWCGQRRRGAGQPAAQAGREPPLAAARRQTRAAPAAAGHVSCKVALGMQWQ